MELCNKHEDKDKSVGKQGEKLEETANDIEISGLESARFDCRVSYRRPAGPRSADPSLP